jgi:catechol 2,3-dioxygenase-like lactoylglutathione lyase family enzyme
MNQTEITCGFYGKAWLSANAISEGLMMECLMDHIVLNVEDDEKMIAFYSKVLMLAPERLEEYNAGDVPFPSVRLNSDTIIDLFPKKMWQKSPRYEQDGNNLNHFCIALTKVTWQELFERLKANNVTIVEGPVSRWGAHGTGTSIYFQDPEGNLIEARYYEGKNDSEGCLLGS